MGWEASHIGNRYSYQFNGIDYFTTPADSSLDLTGSFSYGLMIKPGVKDDCAIACRQVPGTVTTLDGTNTALLIESKQKYLKVTLFDADGVHQLSVITNTPILKTKRIIDIEVTWDSARKILNIYRNAVSMSYSIITTAPLSNYSSVTSMNLLPALSSSVMYIGYAGANYDIFDGRVYDVRYLDIPRDSQDLKAYFLSIKPPPQIGTSSGKIVFTSQRESTVLSPTYKPYTMFTMNSDGCNQKSFYTTGQNCLNPKWSLDGLNVGFVKHSDAGAFGDPAEPQGVYIANSKGGTVRKLANEGYALYASVFVVDPAFGFSSGVPYMLASISQYYNGSPVRNLYKITNYNTNTPIVTAFLDPVVFNPYFNYSSTQIANDNSYLIYNKVSTNGNYSINKVYLNPATGVAISEIILSSSFYYQYCCKLSPDNTLIAWTKNPTQDGYHAGLGQIWIMNDDGGYQKQITNMPYTCIPQCFSPDSQQILFSSYVAELGVTQLFIMDIDGSNMKNISNGRYNDRDADWRDYLVGEEDQEVNDLTGDI